MKVYVLSSGEYSDWSIDGIFSSLETLEEGKAKLAEYQGYSHFNDPEEYELDEVIQLEVGPCWGASIYCKSGEMFNISEKPNPGLLRHPSQATTQTWDTIAWTKGKPHKWAIAVTSPISLEHAIKVATEARQEWLRTQTPSG